jgi:predicted dehydrogenase
MTIRVGLIGCGSIMRPHVEGWKGVSDRAEIVAVADVSEEAMATRAAQIGREVKRYADYRELLADADVDAVDIALPHHLHRESIVAAAEAGKHLMTEKPLCLTMEEANAITSAVETGGIVMMAAHNQLFFPAVLQAKQMLMAGDIGEVYMIHSFDYSERRGPLSLDKSTWDKPKEATADWGWRSDPTKMGGGEYIDTGYHPTYRLLFLAGQKPVQVTAMMGSYRLGLDEEDTANVMVKFADGSMGNVFTSWAMNAPGGRPLLFSIHGEGGQIWGEMDRLLYMPIGMRRPSVIRYPGWDYARTFGAEIAHFVDAIEQGFEPLHSVHEARETLRVILAAYEATDSDRIVGLPA